jgi:Asp-tRNA(Asn)/Glu-tRNA(Gln) amidotransferase A subunit family amidase
MRAFADYEQYDALGLADLVRRGKVTPGELLEAAIERVEARNPAVNAVVMKLYDYGRKAIVDGLPDGPFRGVPYLMKDLTASVAGVRMTRGSKFFADAPPAAAAVGARMLPMAHASDGFGSIRAPAACCGLVGLKPTRSRNTFAPFAGEGLGGLSTEHAVTLTVSDSAALLDATRGAGPGDPYVAPLPARPYRDECGAKPGVLRIAWTAVAPNGVKVEPECLRVLAEIVGLCADLGHRVEERDPEFELAAVVPTFLTLASANTVVNLASHPTVGRPAREEEVERITWLTARLGDGVTAADYVRATQAAHRLGRQMAAFHAGCDVLLTPGLATLPVRLGWIDMMMDDVEEYWRRVFTFSPFTVWFNLTGQPALTLPLGRSTEGLPVSVQLVARFGDEATLFRLGAQLEAARPWFDRKPVLAA